MTRTKQTLGLVGSSWLALVITGSAWAQSATPPAGQPAEAASTPPPEPDTVAAGSLGDSDASPDALKAREIIVRGFRGSIQRALQDKRRSAVQIDEINAQDIADFPDANLAESLQRLPGVSIDRDNGEGRTITVRGLGGDFNRTRLNGMEALSTAGSNDSGSSPNRSRAFDYSTFASELFSALRIQKTPAAETEEGSLGATIDLETGKPFDFPGTKFAFSSQGSYNENSKTVSPRLAALASFRFGEEKNMGFLISGAYNTTSNIIDQYSRGPGASDFLYRGSQFVGEGNPQRAGFAAPTGTALPYANPDAIALMTGSDAAAYAKLFPGAPYNTPGRYDDSQVIIPALPTITHQIVHNQRLGLTSAYQWQVSEHTRFTLDGVYSRFHNESENDQISPVGLNRNNSSAVFNNATGRLTPTAARGAYPGLCAPNAGSAIVAAQDCGQSLYGSTPAFSTALDANGNVVPAVLGNAAVVPGGISPANANIFSTNPHNLDPYDYYNNPNSVGYIASRNGLAGLGSLIGRPAVKVMDADVKNGVADYLVLNNVDFRSAVDYGAYTTTFWQGTARLDQDIGDSIKVNALYGRSRSMNHQTGLLAEFNRMDSPQSFIYDARGGGNMPVLNFGFDAANPANWDTVKGFSALRHYERIVENTYNGGKLHINWEATPGLNINFGGEIKAYDFFTAQDERATPDTYNPTLLEAGSNVAAVSKVVNWGQGLNAPAGTISSFLVPDLQKMRNLIGFDCNCVNQYGDWRLTRLRNGGQNTFSVSEFDKSGYVEADFKTGLFGHDFRGNIGLRVANTIVNSQGTSQAGRPIYGHNNYTDFLPSMNLIYEPTNKLLFRFSASKVIARPLLANLSPTITAISVPSDGSVTGATLTVGNPKLKPFRSNNFDASVEWYFNRSSLLSLAVFDKEVLSFPQTILFSAPLSQFADASTVAAIRAQYTNPNQLSYLDNNLTFTAQQYRDAPGGYLRGIEINYQQNFTFLPGIFKNLGALINFTYIQSKLTYILDPGSATRPQRLGTAPFLNVSPQALNATLFYEDTKLRARVSVSQRGGYATTYPLAAGSCTPGLTTAGNGTLETVGCDSPLINDFVKSQSTTNVDASFSYAITKAVSFTVEGLNLTNQTSNRTAYQGADVTTQYASSGRIYRLGMRATW